MIFLLFYGKSEDERGRGSYCGNTTDPLEAMEHLAKVAKCSIGEVRAYNHNEEQYYRTVNDMTRLIRFVRHTEEYEAKQNG